MKMKVMQKYALHAYPVMALMVATLTGCAWIPAKPLVQGATTAQPIPGPVPVANGSIFQSAQPINYGYQPLFEDRRPRNIGDTLTIVLQENVSASKSSSANASRDVNLCLSLMIAAHFKQATTIIQEVAINRAH
ncbi:Flagellar L-ring protein FlgH [Salmonella enterica subsp. enterica serovar Montevideo str. S5-403]|uniref:Flagellar L-ring protein n=1 Tax=Salmonella enterica subsp. enterica serovar Montevideo str. S5-403 TaxID=913242 RepID=G5Q6P8_SALMO|nr:Flagellar L-ring protein FlgH [Salmonella enterica subsp. enterica serovar Montevideo str. S5-403]